MNLYSNNRGFSLIEVIVGSAVFLLVAISVYGAYTGLFKVANLSQARLVATQLANEEFEIIRNMPYSNIGTVGGVPSGTLNASAPVIRSGITFDMDILVRNIDLPYDGTALAHTDTNPVDNKLVQISIDCPTCQNFSPVVITGQIAPKSSESATADTGALDIRAIDAQGQAVSNVSIRIVNPSASPSIDLTDTTDNDGYLEVYGVATGTNAYKITASKIGYSIDETYPPGASGNVNPLKPNSTVVVGQVTSISFSIDTLSSLSVTSVATSCDPVANFGFSLKGAKTLDVAGLVPKFAQSLQTNGTGSLSIPALEWDSYTATTSDSSYDIAGTDVSNPISIAPGTSQSLKFVLLPKNGNSLLVIVRDSITKALLPHSTVRLTGPSGYDQTLITDEEVGGGAPPACMPSGQILFQGLSAGTYNVSASSSGHSTSTPASTVVGSGWQSQETLLNQ